MWSCVSCIEVFESVICWMPLYYELKLCFVLWLIHPQSHVSEPAPLLSAQHKSLRAGSDSWGGATSRGRRRCSTCS